MKIKKSNILDYAILYWMIIYVFIISWLAYLTQGARILIVLIFLRLLTEFKRTLRLPSLYFGLLFCVAYPLWNYLCYGGNENYISENINAIVATTAVFIYMSFMASYKREFMIDFLKKNKYIFNVYMAINIPILFLQLAGHTELAGRHQASMTNTYSADLVSGLFGYNRSGLLTMYFCFLLLYNFVLYKKKIIKEKQLFVVYNIVLSSIILYVAANSDNKALFVLAPLFFIIYLVVFQMSFYRSAIRKISILIRNVLVGMVIFTVLAYATQPLLGTIDFIQDIFDKSLSGWNSADAALGSAERLGMIVYAVNRTDILWHGAGIATHLWQEAYGLGFAHFGISDFGTFLCLGGVPFIVLMILFFITVYRRVFKDNAICYTFLVLTVIILIYTQLMTVLSLSCSWFFLVFTTLLGCSELEARNSE